MSDLHLQLSENPTIQLPTPIVNTIIQAISPTVTTTEIEDGYKLTITDVNGDHEINLYNGQDGETPERGTDYWTEEDQAAITEDVVTALIDDTAGDGDTDVTWSADKITAAIAAGGGGTTDYDDLTDKPKINSVTLSGNKSLSDLGIASATDCSGKADKVSSATNGNFAALDSNGNLTDSGHKHSDYLTSHQSISGKADKVTSATNGHFAGLDSNGNLTDSGKSASDFGTYSKPSGGIPSSDMASAVQTSLGKADTAYQKPSGGIPSTDMSSAVTTSLGKADTAYQKPSGGIPSTDLASAVTTSLGKADTAYQKPSGGIPGTDLADTYIEEPSSDGTDGQVLATDGDGGRYWKTVSGGGGGTSDYSDLTNKPQINSVTLSGNKSLSDLGIASENDLEDLRDLTVTDSYVAISFDEEETGKVYNTDSQSGTTWSGGHSYILAVTAGEQYKISTTVIGNTIYYAVMYYNGSTYVSGEVQGISGQQQVLTNHAFTIPSGVNKIIVSTYSATTAYISKRVVGPKIDTSASAAIPNYAIYDGTTLTVKCRYNATEDLVVQLKQCNNNNLFEFNSFYTTTRADVLDNNIAKLRNLITGDTDFISAHQIRAVSNGDGDTPTDYYLTGGNHNKNNVATARTTSINVYVDGKKTTSFSGLCSHVRVEWTNLVQGCNTWKSDGTGREILQEDVTLEISGNEFKVSVQQTALEAVYQSVYYGIQMMLNAFNSLLFVGGSTRTYGTANTTRNSGDKKCRRAIAIHTTNKDAMQLSVENEDMGTFDASGETYSMFTANNKVYYTCVRNQTLEMAANSVYCLFGKYKFYSLA